MKRILSVILSLALLASLLIIPMSVSADAGESSAPKATTVEFKNSQSSEHTNPTDSSNLAKGLTPNVLVTRPTSETNSTKVRVAVTDEKGDIDLLSNGKIIEKAETDENEPNTDVHLGGFVFRKPKNEPEYDKDGKMLYNGDYYNGYTPYDGTDETKFDFTKAASRYDAYVDIIYDLGSVASINKIQHLSMARGTSAGAYSVYAAEDVNNLFKDESWVLNYQNKTFVSGGSESDCQEHTLTSPVSARFVAFRIYSVVTSTTGTSNSHFNVARIKELAIYGTKTADPNYTVKGITKYNAYTSAGGEWMDIPSGNLLSLDKLTINGKQDGADKGLKEFQIGPTQYHELLHDNKYGGHQSNRMHADVGIVIFHDGKNFRNGYDIQRDVEGNIKFTQEGPINTYTCFTYNLETRHKITKFMLYGNNDAVYTGINQMQAYEVYVGDNAATLYDSGNKVAEYNNYFNVYGQEITFKNAPKGIYLGVKVLMAEARTNTSNYPRIGEIAALGSEVGNAPVISGVVENGTYCKSATLTVTDTDSTSLTVKVSKDNEAAVVKALDDNGQLTITDVGKYKVVAIDDKNNETEVNFTIANHSLQYKVATDNPAKLIEECTSGDHSKTVTLTKPDGNWVYNNTDHAAEIIDATNATKDDGFIGTVAIHFKKDGAPVTEVKDAGDYVAELTIDGVNAATARLEFKINKGNVADEDVPPVTGLKFEAGKQLGVFSLPAGFTWVDTAQVVKYGKGYKYTASYNVNPNYNPKVVELDVEGVDNTNPKATITIKNKSWFENMVDTILGWFTNVPENVVITGSDAGSGVDKIYYFISNEDITDFKNVEWTEYTKPFKIDKEGKNIVYAKVVDRAGHESTVIWSDKATGIVLDTTDPTSDITLGTYYGSLKFTVTEANLDSVKVDGKTVTAKDGIYTITETGDHTVVITDKVGNEVEYDVTVVEVKGLDAESEEQGEEVALTVDSKDKDSVDKTSKDKIDEKLEKGEKIAYFEIDLTKASGGAITNAKNVFEIKIPFDFAGKNTNVRVLHNHDGVVRELDELTARPTGTLEDRKFYADKENDMIYIYTNKFSTFAVTYHTHTVKHVAATVATAEADGNIEYWYCEECGKYFSDAAATKEIAKADTVVKYVAPASDTENNATVPDETSPGTGETAMTIVLFAILLGALAVMAISLVKSRKAKDK